MDMEPRKFFDALMRAKGYNPTSLSRATGGRTKQSQIVRYISGEALEPRRSTLAPAAKVLGVPVDAFFDRSEADLELSRISVTSPDTFAAMSHLLGVGKTRLTSVKVDVRPILPPPMIPWEELLSSPLPEKFAIVVRDDSMSVQGQRSLSVGDVATFVRADTAKAGDDVLVADAEGNVYIRSVQERTPGHWAALARNPAYQPLDSIADNLRVLGVLKGIEWQ